MTSLIITLVLLSLAHLLTITSNCWAFSSPPWRVDLDYLPDAEVVGVDIEELVVGQPVLPHGRRVDKDKIRKEVKLIIEQGDFDLESELMPSWVGMLFRRLRDSISKRLKGGPTQGVINQTNRLLNSNIVRISLIFLLLFILMVIVSRSRILRHLFSQRSFSLAYQGAEASKLIQQAELLVRQGRGVEAIRLGFLALLDALAIPYYHYLPNRELVRRAEREFPGLGNQLAPLTSLFDQVIYAGRRLDGRAVENYLASCRKLIEEVERKRLETEEDQG